MVDLGEEIYRFAGPTGTGTGTGLAADIFAGSSGGLFSLRDQPPNPVRAFYRLGAELVPQQAVGNDLGRFLI